MFHTPPINPERSVHLDNASRLESYNTVGNGSEGCDQPEMNVTSGSCSSSTTLTDHKLEGEEVERQIVATSPTVSETSSIAFSIDEQPKKDKKVKKVVKKVKRIPYLTYLNLNLPDELYRLIDEFIFDLQAPKYSIPLNTDQVALIFQKFYVKFEEQNKIYCETHEQFAGFEKQFMELMEFKLCGNTMIYNKIFENNVDDLKLQIHLYDKIFYLKNIVKLRLKDLDETIYKDTKKEESQVDENLMKKLKLVSKEFNKMNSFNSCMNKLITMRNAFKILNEIIKEVFSKQVNGDLLIPNLIFLIIMKHIKNLYLNYKFIKRFKYFKFWNSNNDQGEGGEYFYLMTNVLACLTYICNFDYQKDLKIEKSDIKAMFENYKLENENIFKRDFSDEQNGAELYDKRKLLERLKLYDETENCQRNMEFISIDEVCLKLSKDNRKYRIDDTSFDLENSKIKIPAPFSLGYNNESKTLSRKKSNSITFLKNAIQEYSMSILQQEIEYSSLFSTNGSNTNQHNKHVSNNSISSNVGGNSGGHLLSTPSSNNHTFSNSNNNTQGIGNNNMNTTSPSSASSIASILSTTSTNATSMTNNSISGAGAPNNNSQIIKNVFDTSLKFLGGKIAQSTSGNGSATSLSTGHGVPRSGSTLNSLGVSNNSSNTDIDNNLHTRNRSASTINSLNLVDSHDPNGNIVTNSNASLSAALQSRRNRSNSANSYHNGNAGGFTAIPGSPSFSSFMKWKSGGSSTSLSSKIIIDEKHEFTRIEKEFNELSIKELQEVYHNYNLLIDKINSTKKENLE